MNSTTPVTAPSQERAGGPTAARDDADVPLPPPPTRPFRQRSDLLTKTTWIILLVAAGSAFLKYAEAVFLPVVVAFIFAMALRPPTRWLVQFGIPAPLAAVIVMSLLLVPLGYGFSRFARPAIAWFEDAPSNVAVIKGRLVGILRPAQRLSEAAASVGTIEPTNPYATPTPTVEVKVKDDLASTVFTWTGSALIGCAETVALLFLLLASGDSFMQKFVRVMPTWRDKRRVVDITREIQQAISTYLFTVGLINLGFGVVVGISLRLVGMPQPMMWGLIAAVLNFIPYFGPVVGVIVIGLAGLLAFDSVGLGLLPVALYFALHFLEANVFTPLLLGRRMTLNPVFVFVSLMFFVWLWGLPGAFLAVPLIVTARIVGERVPSLTPVAEFLTR